MPFIVLFWLAIKPCPAVVALFTAAPLAWPCCCKTLAAFLAALPPKIPDKMLPTPPMPAVMAMMGIEVSLGGGVSFAGLGAIVGLNDAQIAIAGRDAVLAGGLPQGHGTRPVARPGD